MATLTDIATLLSFGLACFMFGYTIGAQNKK